MTNQNPSPPDWRGLCEELLDELLARPLIPDRALIDRARAALAQPESEVVGPSDESVEAAAQVIYGSMRFDRVDSTSDWAPNGNSFAQDEARRCAHAVLSRFVRPAPAPDDHGVLPMIVSETGADDEPELERIICASISGGADYVNSMPRELMLERITPEGSTFARYIQVDADARPDVRPAPAPAGEVGELVAWLREEAHYQGSWPDQRPSAAVQLTRAADLLEQRHPAPVPVSERLPWSTEPNISGRYICLRGDVYTLYDVDYYRDAQMGISEQWEATEVCKGSRVVCTVASLQPAYWLLVTALPLPSGEVQP